MKLLILYASTGVSLIYGYRLWNDIALPPTFMRIIVIVFPAILASAIVIALEHIIGPIKIGMINHSYSSIKAGLIVFWWICFVVILFGLFLLGGLPENAI